MGGLGANLENIRWDEQRLTKFEKNFYHVGFFVCVRVVPCVYHNVSVHAAGTRAAKDVYVVCVCVCVFKGILFLFLFLTSPLVNALPLTGTPRRHSDV